MKYLVVFLLGTPTLVLVFYVIERRIESRNRKVAQQQGFDWEWQKVQSELKKILGPSAWL